MEKAPFNYDLLITVCREAENPTRAEDMERYMRNQFPFLGISASMRKKILSGYLGNHKLPGKTQWKEVVKKLWEEEEREFQMIGMEIGYRCRKYYGQGDHEFFVFLIANRSWWDTVDFIASNIIGYYFSEVARGNMEGITNQWNLSDNIWLVRTSLLFQLKYKEQLRFDLLSKYILRHRDSHEFFIQKAMGWALRQYSKVKPEEVVRFVSRYELPKLTEREAMKHVNRTNA
jgi:3-methyladenine DNA glycosylase AlkD